MNSGAVQRDSEHAAVVSLLNELVATSGDLKARVTPKYRFTERMHDLTQCLLLDGYFVQNGRLLAADPSIGDASPIDDDLVAALRSSGAPLKELIIQKIADSPEAFRRSPVDYNAALTNSRVALETLASDIAGDLASRSLPQAVPNYSKWGEVVPYLRLTGEIMVEEEHGLAGVYRFISPGAHRLLAPPEEQMARLGRVFALSMCWFPLQNHGWATT